MDGIIEIEGSNIEMEASRKHYVVALAIDGSGKSKNVIRWALEKLIVQNQEDDFFKLIHARPKVKTVPTPMGNYIPISEVRDDVANAYRKEIEWQAYEKLLPYKMMCARKKVKVEIVQVETDDVVQGILGEVSRQHIKKLVIGSSSRRLFSRGKQLSSKMSQLCPRFCTVYVVSKGKLTSLRPADTETSPSSPAYLDRISNSSFSTNTFSLHDYSYQTGDRYDDASSDRTFSGLNEAYTAASSFRSFIDHEEQRWTNDRVSDVESSSEPQVNMIFELEKIRIELKHHREMREMAQSEVNDVTKKLNDLKIKQLDEAVKLTEIMHKQDEAKEEDEEKEKFESAYMTDFAEREAAERRQVEEKCVVDEAKVEEMQEHVSMEGQYRKFTWEEIAIATSSFSEKLKIGKGGYGTVYKGSFHHTVAAVKVRHSKDGYRSKQFHQELEILSKIRHPHLLSLLGACPEQGCLVYEFMENGSLEDYLLKKNNSPLPWFERYRIAWEIATALVYLHTSKPKPIIHRDLKPENILLDRNLISKIGDVGLSTYGSVLYQNTGPVGTFCYIDPEYQRTGVISPKSDVYAFGMIILRLITAKPAMGLAHLVEKAVENESLSDVFDQEGGEWPLMETKELVLLGLRCSELRSRDRPDLQDEILPVLEKLKDAADRARDRCPMIVSLPPNHFICPIIKEVMEEPCVAADGYTYERKAIEVWLENNEKSPMTNLTLPHKHLLPNYTLLSAIREWKSHNL